VGITGNLRSGRPKERGELGTRKGNGESRPKKNSLESDTDIDGSKGTGGGTRRVRGTLHSIRMKIFRGEKSSGETDEGSFCTSRGRAEKRTELATPAVDRLKGD